MRFTLAGILYLYLTFLVNLLMSYTLKNSNQDNLLLVHQQGEHHQDLCEKQTRESYDFGVLNLRQWDFDGITVRESEILFNEPMKMHWHGDQERVTMHFNLKGELGINISNSGQGFSFLENQHNLMYGSEAEGMIDVQKLRQHIFMIQLNKDAFLDIAEHGNEVLMRFADSVNRNEVVALSANNLEISLSIQRCMKEILDCEKFGGLKKMYLKSKTIELLVLQAEAFNNQNAKSPYLKTDYDRNAMLLAKEYMEQHIGTPPTLSELSRIIGINEFKLKKGFKETFGKTVFGFLAEERLARARLQLRDNSRSVSSLAAELGYSSVQHFSNAFKQKYGFSPREAKH